MKNERQSLKRVLGRVEVFALSMGTMVGWGWVMLSVQWIDSAGVWGAILAFLIAGAMCILVGLTYAELTSTFPLAGGELAFSYRGMGYLGSWITGWMISFAYIGVAAWEGIAISTAFEYLVSPVKAGFLWTIAGYSVYFSWAVVGMAGAIVLTLLNLIGVKPVAVFQMLVVLMMLVIGVLFILGGFAFGDVKNLTPSFTDVRGIEVVLLMAPSMYIGFDMVAKSAEEIIMPLKDIAKVLTLSIVAATIWYILTILATGLCAPADFRATALVPAADSAAYAFGSPAMGKVLIVGGICCIISSWNGFIVGASRILFAMGRAKMLPEIFGWVHPKYQTPMASILFVGLICMLSPLLGKNALVWLVHTASFGTVATYLMISLSFLRIRKKEPDLHRRYKVKYGRVIGTAAMFSSGFLLFWYTPFSPGMLNWSHEWGLVLGWICLGIALLSFSEGRQSITSRERELLIFGEEYARETVN